MIMSGMRDSSSIARFEMIMCTYTDIYIYKYWLVYRLPDSRACIIVNECLCVCVFVVCIKLVLYGVSFCAYLLQAGLDLLDPLLRH